MPSENQDPTPAQRYTGPGRVARPYIPSTPATERTKERNVVNKLTPAELKAKAEEVEKVSQTSLGQPVALIPSLTNPT